jgi:predicted HTH transcriptional regulator
MNYPPVENLSPKRQEIVHFIQEHKFVSFDLLSRNFRGINPRTLHYDLSYLCAGKYIRKLGTTRGVLYSPIITGS